MAHEQGVARLQVRGDVLVEDRLVLGVGAQEHDQVGLLGGLGHREHPEPGRLGLGHRRRALAEADPHVDARLLEVEGVGVALRAVADHGDLAAGDERAVGVLLVVHVGHRGVLLLGGSQTVEVGEGSQALLEAVELGGVELVDLERR